MQVCHRLAVNCNEEVEDTHLGDTNFKCVERKAEPRAKEPLKPSVSDTKDDHSSQEEYEGHRGSLLVKAHAVSSKFRLLQVGLIMK